MLSKHVDVLPWGAWFPQRWGSLYRCTRPSFVDGLTNHEKNNIFNGLLEKGAAMLKATIWALGLSGWFCCSAFGQSEPDNKTTVQLLYEACQQARGSPSLNFCLGFVAGTGYLMTVNAAALHKIPSSSTLARVYVGNLGICSADGMSNPTGGAMVQAFINWAAKHPEHWGDMPISGVIMALASTWPCGG
jgi:hypothetical protein